MKLKPVLRRALFFVDVGSNLARMARLPGVGGREFFTFEGRRFTYRETYRAAVRYANMFAELRATYGSSQGPLHIGVYQDNSPEFVFAVFGAALSGDLVFGLNTGLRGSSLAQVVLQSKIAVLITEADKLEQAQAAIDALALSPAQVLLSGAPASTLGHRTVDESIAELATRRGAVIDRRPKAKARPFDPLIVIFTSGTTSAPKGVVCSHLKLIGAGFLGVKRVGLRPSDVGYVCLPLFHSNSWFLGIMPLLSVGARFVLERRFSASAFEDRMLEHGVTYLNYVGQPVHYIIEALERKHGAHVATKLAEHPQNAFRIAHGNGASAADRLKLTRYLGMTHIYELYGSTEAPITTAVRPGDPLDSVGELDDAQVMVVDDQDRPCPPAEVDEAGRILNYDQAVGEIVRQMDRENLFFDGYHDNPAASADKFRGGYYRSGDLGHVRILNGKRYLYFDGRTDDWIRKDGENFSAENVLDFVQRYPPVDLAAAYGVPAEVSDEKVMVALTLREGAEFDPQGAFEWFSGEAGQAMDPKWMPDFIRVVDQLEMTPTQKVLVRPLKRLQFDLQVAPEAEIYFRARGDDRYRRLTTDDFALMTERFEAAGRAQLLAHRLR